MSAPDGSDPSAYSYLRDVDRAGLMWEWARRDSAYIGWYVRASRATRGQPTAPLRWHLLFAEDPALPAPRARILWPAALDPGTLRVTARPAGPRDRGRFLFDRLHGWLALVPGTNGREHAVLSDGFHHLRIDVEAGTLGAGAVVLDYRLPDHARLEAGVLAVRRLMGLFAERRFSPDLFPPDPHPGRWIELLRASDAVRAGASHRDVAEILFGRDRTNAEWHGRSDSLRSRVRRLIGEAARLAGGGYRSLMHGAAARPPRYGEAG